MFSTVFAVNLQPIAFGAPCVFDFGRSRPLNASLGSRINACGQFRLYLVRTVSVQNGRRWCRSTRLSSIKLSAHICSANAGDIWVRSARRRAGQWCKLPTSQSHCKVWALEAGPLLNLSKSVKNHHWAADRPRARTGSLYARRTAAAACRRAPPWLTADPRGCAGSIRTRAGTANVIKNSSAHPEFRSRCQRFLC